MSMESLWEYVNHYDGEVKGTYTKKSEKVFWGLYDHVTVGRTGEQHIRFRDSISVNRYGTPQGIYVNRLIKPDDVAIGAGWNEIHGSFDAWPELPDPDEEPDFFAVTDPGLGEVATGPSASEFSLEALVRHIRDSQ